MQEHWLWSYEKPDANKMFPAAGIYIKSVDEGLEMVEHSHRACGQGGVVTIWKDKLAHLMRPIEEEGNNRIQISECNLPDPLCIVNCYLSSGNSKAAVCTFSEDLDVIYEIIQKYKNTHQIIITGDFNADHYHRGGSKEKLLLELIKENNLRDLGKDSADQYTYVNPHLGHQSRIDHFFTTGAIQCVDQAVTRVINDGDGLNSSYHLPLTSTLYLKATIDICQQKRVSKVKIYKHKEMDVGTYRETLEDLLETINPDILSTADTINALQSAMIGATKASTPYKIVRPGGNKKRIWNEELKNAVQHSKIQHFNWKAAGKPTGKNPILEAKRRATKNVRSILRRQNAEERRKLIKEVSEATERDQGLANKLIRKQRGQGLKAPALWVKGVLTTDEDRLGEAWADYCEELANTKTDPTQELLLEYMRKLCLQSKDHVMVSKQQVTRAITQLKNGKARDSSNLSAEHLKLLPDKAIDILVNVFQNIVRERNIPISLKSAYKLMIPKPGKDSRIMDNYRGITIASILLKVLEHICMESELKDAIDLQQSDMQVGFTNSRSPSLASLLITEAAAEAKHQKRPLFVTSLDAKKAFDVVKHHKLKGKLYNLGINPTWWNIIDDLYTDSKEHIRWNGQDSRSYSITQGVKQGSLISPHLYKLYINDLLISAKHSGLGVEIGSIYIGCPSCADDVTLLSNNANQVQPLLDLAKQYADLHGYQLHPTKSTITELIRAGKQTTPMEEFQWKMGTDAVTKADTFTHLGLTWMANRQKPDVNENIKKARRAAYALLKVGLHGNNGIDPPAAVKIVATYVAPTLLHGMEAAVLLKEDQSKLDIFYKKMLRQILSLPDNTASEAIFILAGTIPLEGQIHQKALGMFGSICRLPANHSIKQLACRQLAMNNNKFSWFKMIANLGSQYNLDIHANLQYPSLKQRWKKEVRHAIRSYWSRKINKDATQKTSLKWLIPRPSLAPPHPIWSPCIGDPRRVEAAGTRARMLTGRFRTQDLEAKFRREEDKMCKLCRREEEDILHMLVRCPVLHKHRQLKMKTLSDLYQEAGISPPTTDMEICSAVLNGDCYIGSDTGDSCIGSHAARVKTIQCPKLITRANLICNLLCKKLARERDLYFNTLF